MKKIAIMVAIVLISATSGRAAPFYTSLSIPGLAGGGNYLPLSFVWGPSPTRSGISNTLTWTALTDLSDQYLISASQSGEVFPTAEIQNGITLGDAPNAEVDIVMSRVSVQSYKVIADVNGPRKVVTLKFDSVSYTFQPLLPTGQKAAPPFTVTETFKK